MAEYIEREAAERAAHMAFVRRGDALQYSEMIHQLARIPSADVAPVRHGRWGHRWICSNLTGYEYACSCSECGKPTYRISTLEDMPPYCPNCGCHMDLEVDHDRHHSTADH